MKGLTVGRTLRAFARACRAACEWTILLAIISTLRIACHTLSSEDARRVYLLSAVGGEPWQWHCLSAIVRRAARRRTGGGTAATQTIVATPGDRLPHPLP